MRVWESVITKGKAEPRIPESWSQTPGGVRAGLGLDTGLSAMWAESRPPDPLDLPSHFVVEAGEGSI